MLQVPAAAERSERRAPGRRPSRGPGCPLLQKLQLHPPASQPLSQELQLHQGMVSVSLEASASPARLTTP
jgi:hypothetical protein